MHAAHPEIADKWDKETNFKKKLPLRVKKKEVTEGTGIGNALMFKWILEVSPVKAGKVAGEVMYKHAKNYATKQSLGNMKTLNKKASQVDRIKGMFANRKIKGRDLGTAFDEHKRLAMDKGKFKDYKAPKAIRPPLAKRMKNSWNNLDRHEKILVGMLGGSVAASTLIGAAEVRAENRIHKKGKAK